MITVVLPNGQFSVLQRWKSWKKQPKRVNAYPNQWITFAGYIYHGMNWGEHEGKPGIWYREWAPGAWVRFWRYYLFPDLLPFFTSLLNLVDSTIILKACTLRSKNCCAGDHLTLIPQKFLSFVLCTILMSYFWIYKEASLHLLVSQHEQSCWNDNPWMK